MNQSKVSTNQCYGMVLWLLQKVDAQEVEYIVYPFICVPQYVSKNPELFPTTTKTLPQHNDNF